MNYWLITDTHFGHDKMKLPEYSGRPDDFEDRIFKGIYRNVRKGDVLIHLGDVSIHDNRNWHSRYLSTWGIRHWLIRGNHDKKSHKWYMDCGWSFVGDAIVLEMFGKRILLTHKPAPDGDYDINIHGHGHNDEHHEGDGPAHGKNKLFFIEHEYRPVKLRSFIE